MGLRQSKRLLGAVMVAGLIGSASYAMTASNTFASTANKAGTGSQTISGFAVSDVNYTLDSLDPTKYSAVAFTLDGTAGDVRAKVKSTATTYSTCSIVTGMRWTCPITNTVAESDALAVIAVQ